MSSLILNTRLILLFKIFLSFIRTTIHLSNNNGCFLMPLSLCFEGKLYLNDPGSQGGRRAVNFHLLLQSLSTTNIFLEINWLLLEVREFPLHVFTLPLPGFLSLEGLPIVMASPRPTTTKENRKSAQ